MAQMDDLESELSELTTVAGSIEVLLKRLSQQIKDAGVDPARLKAVTDGLDKQTKALVAAVLEHTPAEEPPPDSNV